MRNIKLSISVLVIVVLLGSVFMLSGCVFSKEPEATAVPTEDPNAVQVTDLGKFISVVPDDGDAVDYTAGNEIAKQKIIETIMTDRGVKIDFEVVELPLDNYYNEFNNLRAATNIDSITVDESLYNAFINTSGSIKPLNDLLTYYGSNLQTNIEQYAWDEVTENGQIMAVPSMNYPEETILVGRADKLAYIYTEPITDITQIQGACNGLIALGIQNPLAVTWDQLIDIFGSTYRIMPNDYGIIDGGFYMREQLNEFKYDFLGDMREYYEKGFFQTDLFTATAEDMKSRFMSGNAGFYAAEYDSLIADRAQLRQAFPEGELTVLPLPVSPIVRDPELSAEDLVESRLIVLADSQHSEALMTYLDWSYSSQLNHTMPELGAYGSQIMYNYTINEYEYVDETQDYYNKPYNGLYELGLSTDKLYSPITHREYTYDFMSINSLLTQSHEVLMGDYDYQLTVDLNETAQSAYDQYKYKINEGVQRYVSGEIDFDDYKKYEYDCRESGLIATLSQEIGVPLMYQLGMFD